jgi:SRSO17 transposase
MSDNRSPEDNELVRNVALLNMLYARRHGYQFQLVLLPYAPYPQEKIKKRKRGKKEHRENAV